MFNSNIQAFSLMHVSPIGSEIESKRDEKMHKWTSWSHTIPCDYIYESTMMTAAAATAVEAAKKMKTPLPLPSAISQIHESHMRYEVQLRCKDQHFDVCMFGFCL